MVKAQKALSLMLSVVMLFSIAAVAFAADTFSDVDASLWYHDDVEYVAAKGLMNGIGGGKFAGEGTTTRSMVVTTLYRLEKEPSVSSKSTFEDIAAGSWYEKAVDWAAAKGIVKGYDEKTFGPDDLMTREQLVTVFYRYASVSGRDVSAKADLTAYKDAEKLSDWSADAFAWAVAAGIVKGISEDMLGFELPSTRGQLAVILRRFDEKFPAAAASESYAPYVPAPEKKELSDVYIVCKDASYVVCVDPAYADSDAYMIGKDTYIVSADSAVYKVKEGAPLSLYVKPDGATYSVKWLSGTTVVGEGATYTVSGLDLGKTLRAEITGTGSTTGTVLSAGAVVHNVSSANVYKADPDTVVAAVSSGATFADASGSTIVLTESSVVNVEVGTSEVVKAEEVIATNEEKENVASTVAKMLEVDSIAYDDIKDNVYYVAIDVDLVAVIEEGNDPEKIHSVGATTVTLSKANLGLEEDADLESTIFFAKHTNVKREEEMVAGKVVTINDEQYIRFELNGLSRIVIGNVPPRTVTFDTDGGTPVPEPQTVKFGGYAKYVEPPVKAGYIFIGWDHNIKEENVLYDMTVKALWTQGTLVQQSQLAQKWTVNGQEVAAPDDIEVTFADGTLTLRSSDNASLSANLKAEVTVSAPDSESTIAKYATDTTAEGAAASEKLVNADTPLTIVADITDSTGKVSSSNKNTYIKWVDENDEFVVLQSVRVVVASGDEAVENYDTKFSKADVPVDRGIGVLNAHLTEGKYSDGTDAPDYEAYVNGYLNSRWENNESHYYLNLYTNFTNSFNNSFWDSEKQEQISRTLNSSNYKKLVVEYTPFEGESFTEAGSAEGTYNNGTENVKVEFTSELKDGKLVFTADMPELEAGHNSINVTFTYGDKTQNIRFSFFRDRESAESTSKSVETWDEVIAALKEGISYIHYRGTDDVVITDSIVIEPGQTINVESANVTVADGGSITLNGSTTEGAFFNVTNALTVEKGGVLTTNSQDTTKERFYTNVNADSIVLKSGAKVTVPENGLLYLQTASIEAQEGSEISADSNGSFEIYLRDYTGKTDISASLNGKISDNGYFYFYGNGNYTIGKTGVVELGEDAYINMSCLTVNNGTITNKGYVYLSGRFENNGTINIDGGRISFQNVGYSDYNSGNIVVAKDAYLHADGTVLVNTGAISGDGVAYEGNVDNTADYENGIEYVNRDNTKEYAPDNYNHYKFVQDPADHVTVITFEGEISGSGTVTATVR